MITANLSSLANHLWQSTLFAAAIWLLTVAMRKNRAAVRHGLWLAASLKFLVPFSLLVAAGSQFAWRTPPAVAPAQLSRAVEQISRPFAPQVEAVPAAAASASWNPLPIVLWTVWLCGFTISAVVWFRWWRSFRAAIRQGTPLDWRMPVPVMTSPGSLEPGVFGIRKPVLLLPEGIGDRLTPGQLQSILAHELCHVRRHDNLTAAIHMLVESIFWFHPLVWWIGARLVEERERACDEEVLRQGAEPDVYAEGILNVCRFYLQSPLACASGVTGADLRKRIEAIVSHRIAPRLTAARILLLATAGMAAIGAPVLVGLWHAPASHAQSRAQTRAQTQAGTGATEKLVFEVASIKRVDPAAQNGGRIPLAPGVTPGGGVRSFVTIFQLMCWAYRIDGSQLSGGPAWVRSDRYAIEAKAEKFEGPEDPSVPISEERTNRVRERVKKLLADRFQLALRTETKEASVYVLSVAKGGHKLTPDPEGRDGIRRGAGVIQSFGAPVSFLAVPLTQMLERPVLDETGIEGRFSYKLEFRPQNAQEKLALAQAGEPVADDDPRPSIFTAIKDQLGLELQSRKGPVLYIVIERIERPTEN